MQTVSLPLGGRWGMVLCLVVGLCGLLVYSTPGHAQKQADSSPQITSFAGVPFGSNQDAIKEKHGKPRNEKVIFRDLRTHTGIALSYQKIVLDRVVSGFFYVDSEQGLVKGLYAAAFGNGKECQQVYRDFREHFLTKYSNIKPREHRENKSDLSFCEAVKAGEARWMMQWEDPVSETQIGMYLMPGSSHVLIHYDTLELRNIMETSN